ncbi:MAG TPA: hypothetical protein VMZ25_06865, partial [Terriglobales bacterium]|nr:hypothetical protein [Terriglobales bacterium]
SYLVTQDGREIAFTYDPVEREFILAPAWRRLKALVAPLLPAARPRANNDSIAEVETIASPATAMSEVEVKADVGSFNHASQLADVEDLEPTKVLENEAIGADAIDTAVLKNEVVPAPPVEPSRQSLYMNDSLAFESEPEPEVEFSSAEYFDGGGQRRTFDQSTHEMAAPASADVETIEAATAAPVVPAEPVASRTPWLVTAAEKAEGTRLAMMAKLHARRRDAIHHARRLRGYDESWLRAMPVAAIITIAFLLGWGFSGAQRTTSASPVTNTASLPAEGTRQAAVIPVAAAKPAVVKTWVAAKPAPKRVVRRAEVADYDENDDIGQDVVVRHYPKHYPSKAVSAANRKTVKRFSDIE